MQRAPKLMRHRSDELAFLSVHEHGGEFDNLGADGVAKGQCVEVVGLIREDTIARGGVGEASGPSVKHCVEQRREDDLFSFRELLVE